VRLEIHPLAFLVGSLLLCATWLALRPTPPPPIVLATRAAHVRERKTIELPADVLSRYVGSYLLDQTVEIKMELDGSRLFAISEGTPRYELKPTSEKEFYLPDLDTDVAFEVDANERVVGFSAKLPMGTITAKRTR
jgi:uncharacterized protein DUF3471